MGGWSGMLEGKGNCIEATFMLIIQAWLKKKKKNTGLKMSIPVTSFYLMEGSEISDNYIKCFFSV